MNFKHFKTTNRNKHTIIYSYNLNTFPLIYMICFIILMLYIVKEHKAVHLYGNIHQHDFYFKVNANTNQQPTNQTKMISEIIIFDIV